MTDRSDGQRGAQMHPEGGHGDRTREQHREQRESGPSEARADDAAPVQGISEPPHWPNSRKNLKGNLNRVRNPN